MCRLASVTLLTAFALGGLATPSQASHVRQCGDEEISGSVIESGNPTTQVVQTSYVIKQTGAEARATIPSVGIFIVEANTIETGVTFLAPNGTPIFVLGTDLNGGTALDSTTPFDIAACVLIPGIGSNAYVELWQQETRPGLTASVFTCNHYTNGCAPVLRRTGVVLTPNVLQSCIYVDGVNRNSSAVPGTCPDSAI